MKAADRRVSFAELQQWPDDGRRYELYDGEAIVVSSPFPRHQRVVLRLLQIVGEYENAAGGLLLPAPIDIVITDYDVVQPDLVFFCAERRHLVQMSETTRVAPDLAVEVLSRSTERLDRGRKMALLARLGVPEYWIVDPIGGVLEIYDLRDGRYGLVAIWGPNDHARSATLVGLTFDTRRVFED